MSINTILQKIQEGVFDGFIIVSYFLIAVAALGFSQYAPKYLHELDYYAKIYISLFLIIRFNSFRRVQFTDFDRKVALNAGIFLLMTTVIAQYAKKFVDKAQTIASKEWNKLV
jgi:hypothetical protein